MRYLAKPVIEDNWDNLINDIQGDVIKDCYDRSILTDCEYETIRNLDNEQQMVSKFLKVMKTKSDEQFEGFIECLQEFYSWLQDILHESISHLKKIDPLYKTKKLGGIPNLPLRIIERTSLLNQLKNGLKKLKKGGYLVLHGMLGCGKTTLAAAALDDYELVTHSFKNTVYWLTVGKVGEDDLGLLQQQLNERFPDPIQQLSPTTHLATIQITKMIEKGWSDSLIVLDDVRNKTVLDAFAVGAKFLVITEDKDIIGKQHKSAVDYIKVDEGFSSEETLELFSKSLKVKSSLLPKQALDIHRSTKGHPLTISLIASQLENFRDSVLNDNSRWDHYVRILSRKKDRRSLNDSHIFYNAMNDSIASLSKEHEEFFRQLAVFVEDVNIKPEVLGVLWNLEKHHAEDVMMDFVGKSLAVTKWNEVQKSYVYGVHDLVSNFLKENLSEVAEKKLHQNLISNYKMKCKGIWCELPRNDNYIFYYIGYHARKADYNDLFQLLYFDLAFLEAKLQVCGPADLIRDFKTYKSSIINKDFELEKKVDEFRTFVEYHGVSIAQGIDIIQAALQEPTLSKVHLSAVQLAKRKKSKQLYLYCYPLSEVDKTILPETLDIKEEITIVCFGTSVYEVIVASGPSRKNLKLYNIRTKELLKEFRGHTGDIRNLDVSCCKPQFLSASFDSTIRVWSLGNGESSQGDRSPSPREIQSNYINLFNTNETDKDKALLVLNHDHPLLWGVFSKKQPSLIASLGINGSICVWDYDVKKWKVNHSISGLRCLDFFDSDNFIAVGGHDELILCFAETGTLFEKHEEFKQFISLRSLPGSLGGGMVVLTKNSLSVYPGSKNEIATRNIPLPEGLLLKQLHSVGTHIATTTDSGELYVFHFLNGSVVAHFPTMSRQVSSICVNDRAILSGYSDGSLYLYPLEGLPCPLTSIKWKLDKEPVLVKMDHSQENIEVVIGKQKRIVAERNARVKMADVSSKGTVIVMACEGGQVTYKDMDHHQDEVIINHHNKTLPSRLCLLENDSEKIVVALYENENAVMWKAKEKKVIKLNDRSIGCHSANLLQLKHFPCLITAFPMTIWKLNGDPIDCGLLHIHRCVKTYCVSPDFRTLVYAGDRTWMAKWYGNIYNEIDLGVESAELLSFSPSSKILALLNGRGFLIVFDCEMMKKEVLKEIREPTTCLAVSDSGCVCLGGSNHLSIVAKRNGEILSSKIVLDAKSIVAKDVEDKFAVADNAGIIYIICLLDITNGEDDTLIHLSNLKP